MPVTVTDPDSAGFIEPEAARWGDDKLYYAKDERHGVVCYRWKSSTDISCVKVGETK